MGANILRDMLRKFLTVLLMANMLLFEHSAMSQTTQFSLPQLSSCVGEDLIFPLTFQNLSQVGALSLYISYDTAVLEYNGHLNAHPQFPGMISNAMLSPAPQVGILWSGINPSNPGNGILLELLFSYKKANTPLNFTAACEITRPDFSLIPYVASNGAVNQSYPLIVQQPEPAYVTEGYPAYFSVESIGGSGWQWQTIQDGDWVNLSNNGIYQGVNSPALTITEALLNMDSLLYRCYITADNNCGLHTDQAMLRVMETPVVFLHLDDSEACPSSLTNTSLHGAGLVNIVQMNLNIAYDPAVVTFAGLGDIHPLLQGATTLVESEPVPHVQVTWESTDPITLPDSVLLQLLFVMNQGSTPISFLESSGVTGAGGIDYYIVPSGALITSYPLPGIVTQPVDLSLYPLDTAFFSVVAPDAVSFQWYESRDGGNNWELLSDGGVYTGTQTEMLSIWPVELSMDLYQYKCLIEGIYCDVFTLPAQLSILPVLNVILLIPDVQSCANELIEVPFFAAGLSAVVSIDFFIGFKPDVLIFEGLTHISLELQGITATVLDSPEPHLHISWSGSEPVVPADALLFRMVFQYVSGFSGIVTREDSEILDSLMVPYDLSFVNGSVEAAELPVILNQPDDILVTEGSPAVFEVVAPESIAYQWYESSDNGLSWRSLDDVPPYQGVHTPQLTIMSVPASLNESSYRCRVSGQYCYLDSDVAQLMVDTLTTLINFHGHATVNKLIGYQYHSGMLWLNLQLETAGEWVFHVYDLKGLSLSTSKHYFESSGRHHISIKINSSATPAIILLRAIHLAGSATHEIISAKMIIGTSE